MCTKHVPVDDLGTDEVTLEASSLQARNADLARKRGKLTAAEKEEFAAKWQELSEEDLEDLIERFETQLRHHVYKAADLEEADQDQEPYCRLQRSRDLLYLARATREYRRTDKKKSFTQYISIIRLQCLCRWYLARLDYKQRLQVSRESTEILFECDERNEAALVIQGMVRQRFARKELTTRQSRAASTPAGGAVAAVKAAAAPHTHAPSKPVGGRPRSAGFGPRPPSSPHAAIMHEQAEAGAWGVACSSSPRRLPMDPNTDSPLPPGYHVTDITNVPLSEDELQATWAQLRAFSQSGEAGEASTDRISKLAFKNYYNTQEHYGVAMTDVQLDAAMATYTSKGMDWLSFDEFAVLTLRLSQR